MPAIATLTMAEIHIKMNPLGCSCKQNVGEQEVLPQV